MCVQVHGAQRASLHDTGHHPSARDQATKLLSRLLSQRRNMNHVLVVAFTGQELLWSAIASIAFWGTSNAHTAVVAFCMYVRTSLILKELVHRTGTKQQSLARSSEEVACQAFLDHAQVTRDVLTL